MQNIFSDLAKGNDQSFLEAMAEEMKWTWMGSGNLAKTFDGKDMEVLARSIGYYSDKSNIYFFTWGNIVRSS